MEDVRLLVAMGSGIFLLLLLSECVCQVIIVSDQFDMVVETRTTRNGFE